MKNQKLEMRNEKTASKWKLGFLPLLIALCSLLFVFACVNPFDLPETKLPGDTDGKAVVSLNFALGRTVFPPINAFDSYEVFFSKDAASEGDKVEPTLPGGLIFTVEAEVEWNITVKAYVDTNLAATGKTTITPARNVNNPVNINLVGVTTTGMGTFRYHIDKPAAAVIDSISLQRINGMNLEASVLTGTADVFYIDIPAGFYLFSIELSLGPRKAGGIEAVHIYNGLTTTYNVNFRNNDFFIPATVSNNVIQGVTAPVFRAEPVPTITPDAQFTGIVEWWAGSEPFTGTTFECDTLYRAVIRLSPEVGYSFAGVTEDFFTVAGAEATFNDADTGLVTVVFPKIEHVRGAAATCTNPQTCNCGYYEFAPALGHDFDWEMAGIKICKRNNCNANPVIGSRGPAGGIIFHITPAGFNVQGYTQGSGTTAHLNFPAYTAHYLEAAPSNMLTNLQWATNNDLIPNLSLESDPFIDRNIGRGRVNTSIIIARGMTFSPLYTTPAASACFTLTTGGKTDWFLPSIEELNTLAQIRGQFGIPNTGDFWSSSQIDSFNALTRDFSIIGMGSRSKVLSFSVRAVRAF